jgi:hypothetical protein
VLAAAERVFVWMTVVVAATNGLTASSGIVYLGGTLTEPTTTIVASASNLLAFQGLQTASSATDYIVYADPITGVLKQLSLASSTTHTLSALVNTMTSTVNGVTATSDIITQLLNTSTGNVQTITVNGSTDKHIQAAAAAIKNLKPRVLPQIPAQTRLSGLEPLNITPTSGFMLVGERTNVTGSPKFKKMILENNFEAALAVALQQVQAGANIIDINFDEAQAKTHHNKNTSTKPKEKRTNGWNNICEKRKPHPVHFRLQRERVANKASLLALLITFTPDSSCRNFFLFFTVFVGI